MRELPKVMIVDDRIMNIRLLEDTLDSLDVELVTAQSGEEALSLFDEEGIAVLLLDVEMPGMNGYELATKLREMSQKEIPIIFITAMNRDQSNVETGYEQGAVDFIFKPLDPGIVRSKVKIFIKLWQVQFQLQISNEELAKALQFKEELVTTVAHDLKNPLGFIRNGLDLLMEQDGDFSDGEKRDVMVRASKQATVALNLVTDLLEVAALEGCISLKYAKFKLNDLILDAVDAFAQKCATNGITLIKEIDQDYHVFADYGRILQVFNNLIANALKFTPSGGQITVAIKNCTGHRASDRGSDYTCVSVADTGRGIHNDKLKSIFKKFTQAEENDRRVGTGLGLTICKTICQLHKGNIWAESKLGKGSTFYFDIPHSVKNFAEVDDLNKNIGKTILIVDDNEDVRFVVRMQLEYLKFNVLEVEDGREALDFLATTMPDLVLLDIDMPVLDGIETLTCLRGDDRLKDLPVIMHSSQIMNDDFESLHRSAQDYIMKPAEITELEFKINRAIRPVLAKSN